MDLIASTFVNLFFGWTLLYLLFGVLVGLLVGILPALGTTAALALLIPFIYGMEPTSALALMTGMLAVVATGDTVSSVLLGIPGAASSQATVVDGFPMAKKGEAARALSAAYFSSMIGGVFAAIVLTAAILVARPIILAFGSGEMLMLVILGITMVSTLSGPSLLKGLIAASLGMVFGSIGPAPATGHYRLDFGSIYLSGGLPLAVVALAMFAIPEVNDLLRRGQSIAKVPPLGQGWWQGIVDNWRNKWLVLRCSAIGCLLGMLPVGGTDWITYGHAVQTSKPRDGFGKGDVRGVIAPESANNASDGGALVPALIFGVPFKGSTAVFLGGLIILGIQPGPSMVGRDIDIMYTIIWTLAIANVFGAGICFLISGQMAKLTKVPVTYLAPFLLTVVFFGAYQSNQSWSDLILLIILGCYAIFLRRFGYSRPAFLIGFVLSRNIEVLLYQTIQLYSFESLASRPLIWILAAIIAASLWFGLKYRPKLETEGRRQEVTAGQMVPQILFVLFSLGLVLIAIYDVWNISFFASVFPLTVSGVAITLLGIGLGVLIKRDVTKPMVFDSEANWLQQQEEGYTVGIYHYMMWIGGLLVAMFLVGFLLGLALFFIAFLRTKTDAGFGKIAAMTGITLAILVAFSYGAVLPLPSGILQSFVAVPWPFN